MKERRYLMPLLWAHLLRHTAWCLGELLIINVEKGGQQHFHQVSFHLYKHYKNRLLNKHSLFLYIFLGLVFGPPTIPLTDCYPSNHTHLCTPFITQTVLIPRPSYHITTLYIVLLLNHAMRSLHEAFFHNVSSQLNHMVTGILNESSFI